MNKPELPFKEKIYLILHNIGKVLYNGSETVCSGKSKNVKTGLSA